MRVDCTVVESNIHNPTDSWLLWDSVRVLARLTKRAIETFELEVDFVNHSRRAKKRALEVLNAKSDKERKKAYKGLLQVARQTVTSATLVVEALPCVCADAKEDANTVAEEMRTYVVLAQKIVNQAEQRVFHDEKLPPQDKVVSIFEPHTDIIVKDRRETYYGHKVTITGGVSGIFTDLVVQEGNPADTTLAVDMITRQKGIYGRMPLKAAFDGGFACKENLKEVKELGVRDVTFRKKRGLKISDMVKSTWVYKRMCDFRAGIEGMISFLKRCFGLRRCTWSGLPSFRSYAWASVATANLLLMGRHLLAK